MLKPGICSISFRKLSPDALVQLAVEADLQGIEWGGDVHVPHGDLDAARRAVACSRDAGLACPSYGSYYRVGESESAGLDFECVVETAAVLGAETIRVWAGNRNAEDADAAYIDRVVAETTRVSELAATAAMTVSFEFHNGTLTNTGPSALALADRLPSPHVAFYWQPIAGLPAAAAQEGLLPLLPRLSNVHVFHWTREDDGRGGHRVTRHLLEAGVAPWRQYLATLTGTGRDHWLFLEFAHQDDPAAARADGRTLNQLLGAP